MYTTISSRHGSIQRVVSRKKKKSHFATQSQMIKSGIQKLKVFKKQKKKRKKKKEKRQSPKGKKKKKNKRHAASLYATLYEPLELPKTLLSKIFNNNLKQNYSSDRTIVHNNFFSSFEIEFSTLFSGQAFSL